MADAQAETIERILDRTRRIAVVGLSGDPSRTSHQVAAVLQRRGYEIVPVNPNEDEVLGQPAYPSLDAVPGHIDLVDVFRRQEYLYDVARQAAQRGDIDAVWNQLGLRSEEARRAVEAVGMDYVEDRCLKVEVARLAHDRELPPAAA